MNSFKVDLEGREGWDLRFKTIHFNITSQVLDWVCVIGEPLLHLKNDNTLSPTSHSNSESIEVLRESVGNTPALTKQE